MNHPPAPFPGLNAPPASLAPNLRSEWLLDPTVTFLNHGSFGATPRGVLDEQSRLREELEQEPILFLDRRGPEMIGSALEAIGRFLGAKRSDLGFVANATEGVASVMRSLTFRPGDEIVTTRHAYDAVSFTLQHVVDRAGARVVRVPIETPFVGDDEFIEVIRRATTARTRLVVVDHVTSVSALVLPVARIVESCAERGVDVLVDGAHAAGMVDVNIERINAAYYTGNLHKWVCAPKGAAFLWVRADRQRNLHPAIISNNYGKGFIAEFNWQATRDVTPWLSVPAAIRFFDRLGWDRVREHNHRMACWVQALLTERWSVEPISHPDGRSIGSMVSVPLPAALAERYPDRAACAAAIFDRFRIEVPVMVINDRMAVRASCHVYNQPQEYEKLAEAVIELLGASAGVE